MSVTIKTKSEPTSGHWKNGTSAMVRPGKLIGETALKETLPRNMWS